MLQLTLDNTYEFTSDLNNPANLTSNNYFPFINLRHLNTFNTYFENCIQTYYKPNIVLQIRLKANSSRNILESLTYSSAMHKYVFTTSTYFIGKGIIMDQQGKILLLTTVKKDFFKTYDIISKRSLSEEYDSFSYDNFVMFVSSELACKPEHSVFYRRLQKIYLNFCFEKGMEVRFLPSSIIEKNTFASSMHLRFNSIDQLDYHLRNEVRNFLLVPEITAQQRCLHINMPPVDIIQFEVENITGSQYFEQGVRMGREDAESESSMEAFNRDVNFIRNDLNIVNTGIVLVNDVYVTQTSSNYIGGIDPYLSISNSIPLVQATEEETDPDIIII
jgi:hypothetical protein